MAAAGVLGEPWTKHWRTPSRIDIHTSGPWVGGGRIADTVHAREFELAALTETLRCSAQGT